MIKVEVNKENNKYKKISMSGHALYDDYGKDIVCSAASTIAITTINGILTLNENGLSYQEEKGALQITNISEEDYVQKLLDNMINLLKELETNYPKNIKVK